MSFKQLIETLNKCPISIGIITKDRPEYLRDALKSLEEQTLAPAEIIIFDDGSAKSLEPILNDFPNLPITLIESESSRGRPFARNTVVENLRSSHLMWLDDDDALLPQAIESHASVLRELPETDILYGNLVMCNERLNPVYELRKTPLTPDSLLETFLKTNPVPNGGTVISQSTFEVVGTYDEYYQRGQDYDFFARAASKRMLFVHNNDFICLYRNHPGSTASKIQYRKHLKYRSAVIRSLVSRHTLTELYPNNPWSQNPELALLVSCQALANNFVRAEDFDSAVDVFKQVKSHQLAPLISHLCDLIKCFNESDPRAILKLQENRALYTEMSYELISNYLEPWNEPEVANKLFQEIYSLRTDYFSLPELFPQFDWGKNPEQARSNALCQLASDYIERGDNQKGKSILNELEDDLKNQLVPLTSEQSTNIFTPEAQKIISAFGRNKSKQNQWNQEKKLSQLQPGSFTLTPRPSVDSKTLSICEPILAQAVALKTGATKVHLPGDLHRERHFNELISIESTPLLSVVIPTFKRKQLLCEAVLSVRKQDSSKNLEIVVVDDCGEELDMEFLRQSQCVVIQHTKNLGLAAARNTGALQARGKHLLFLDDDDLLVESSLEKLLADRTSDVVIGDHIRLKHNEDNLLVDTEYYKLSNLDLSIENSDMPTGSFMVSKERFFKLEGYQEQLPVHEDYNLHLRLLSSSKATYCPTPIFYYRIGASKTNLNSKRFFWFATAALNHAIYSQLFNSSEELLSKQKENQFSHLARAVKEGGSRETARSLVEMWWELNPYNIAQEQRILQSLSSPIISGHTWKQQAQVQ